MHDLDATHERLIKTTMSLIDNMIEQESFPTRIVKHPHRWSWHSTSKKYTGTLWFHTCEPSPTLDHTFYMSVGRHNVRLLTDSTTLVIREREVEEARFRLDEIDDEQLRTGFWGRVSNLLYTAFTRRERESDPTQLRMPGKRLSRIERIARRAERRRLRAVCRER